jgi:hypothetical protein
VFSHQDLEVLEIFDLAECFEDLGGVEVLSNFVIYCFEILAAQNKSRESFHLGNMLHHIRDYLLLFHFREVKIGFSCNWI